MKAIIKQPRVAEQIATQLEAMIQDGRFGTGDRLPAERTLAKDLGVSRPSLREAIQMLVTKGLLRSRPGDGTFVEETIHKKPDDPMLTLFREDPAYRFDVLEVRHALEESAAYYAALRATDEDKERIQNSFNRMLELHGGDNPMQEARADALFHLSIAEASQNLVLLHVMRSLFEVLQNSISHNLDKLYTQTCVFESLSAQHNALMEAILKGEPEAAREAAQKHLSFVTDSIKRFDAQEAQKQQSLNRRTILGDYAQP